MITTTVFALLVAGAVLLVALVRPRGVRRARVARFARRQALPITVGNGAIVISYLATTRRWRTAGLVTGVAAVALYEYWRGDIVQINALAMFFGWFGGAVVAEWRVSVAAVSDSRIASLVPRRLADYVPRYASRLQVLVWLLATGVDLAGFGYGLATGRGLSWSLLGWLVALIAIGAGARLVAAHVLSRPQPLVADDALAADDAIRSRSLLVITGSTIAMVGYLATGIVAHLARELSWFDSGAASAASAIGLLVTPVLGVLIATTAAPVARRAVLRDPGAVGAAGQ